MRNEKGGELAKSIKLRHMLNVNQQNLETTSSESIFQIGKVERLNQTLDNTMRAILLGSSRDSKFWSDAMLYATYLKNRIPHQSLDNNKTSFEAWTGHKPDLSHLRMFGSLMHAKKPGMCRGKLDTPLTSKGILLGFTSTNRNAIYYDTSTKEKKYTRHCIIDEAHYSSKTDMPPFANDVLANLNLRPQMKNHHLRAQKSLIPSPKLYHINFYLNNQPNAPSFIMKLPVKGSHPTLGFETSLSDKLSHGNQKDCAPFSRPSLELVQKQKTGK